MLTPATGPGPLDPGPLDPPREWLKCGRSVPYFVRTCVRIYDANDQAWIGFDLWPAQVDTLVQMAGQRKLVVLKARQLGISWLALAYALWLLLFRAPATVLLFSLREAEAKELLWRLRGMYAHLPEWLHCRSEVNNNATRWELSNGSRTLAFSTRAGRSYTGTLALVDEADFVPDLGRFLNAVKPTIDAGGQLFLVSTSDKHRPQSTFKNLFRAAYNAARREDAPSGSYAGDYRAVFLPWSARPGRDAAWHDRVRAEMFAQRGTHDDFYAEYPATPEEALAAEQLDRRIPLDWLRPCLACGADDARGEDAPSGSWVASGTGRAEPDGASSLRGGGGVPGLTVYDPPLPGHRYVIGADPAEGNPHSDESAACVLDGETWAQVAVLAGKLEPSVFAAAIDQVGVAYNGAAVMAERNNHGHLLIRELQRLGHLRVLAGYDGKPGWLSNVKGKPLLYGLVADAVRAAACRIRCTETATQLASIEASTLRAPAGLHDDRADAFALAIAAVAWQPLGEASTVVEAEDPLAEYDRRGW